MKWKKVNLLVIFVLMIFSLQVKADIKCGNGKPGDSVNCVVSNVAANGLTKNIKADNGLTFKSCTNCDNSGNYILTKNTSTTFVFGIANNITENKTLKVEIAGQTGSIKVVTNNTESSSTTTSTTTTTNANEVTYTVTLVPGKNQSNLTKTCNVNSLNPTCNVTLDELDDPLFNGWGEEKDCTEGSRGNIKVNKDITYYACYKNSTNEDLLLKSLVVKANDEILDFDFSIRTREYDIMVGLDVKKLDIEAEAQDEDVEITIEGNEELKDGDNVVTITLTDKDGSSSVYTLNVNRTDEILPPKLTKLVVGGVKGFNFQSDVYDYSITIDKKITELILDYETEKETQTVEVLNNENLKDGSQVRIVVTDEETNLSSTYVLNIQMESSNLLIYIIIGAVLLIILIVLLIVVIKKGKKNKKEVNPGAAPKQTKGKKAVSKIPEVKSSPATSSPKEPTAHPVTPTPAPKAPVPKKEEKLETLDF